MVFNLGDLNAANQYEQLKKRFPMKTTLDGNILNFIDEVDSTFRKRYQWFFKGNDPRVDNTSVDGILDWLYGQRHFLSPTNKEYRLFTKIIKNIEKHIL